MMRAKDHETKEASRMGALHVWTADSEEWVVAESAEDACRVYCEHIGWTPVDAAAQTEDDADWGTMPSHWTQCADDHVLKWGEECPEVHGSDQPPCLRKCDVLGARSQGGAEFVPGQCKLVTHATRMLRAPR